MPKNPPADTERFKRLFYQLYSNFPRTLTSEEVEQIIPLEDTRKMLERHGYLYIESTFVEKRGNVNYYALGPNSLALISMWETERITQEVKLISILTLVVAILTLLVTVVPFIAKCLPG